MNTLHFTDDTLSAFLDGELPEAQMELVRNALVRDKTLAARLATLTEVNALVKRQAHAVDDVPMPAAVLALLDVAPRAGTGQVIRGPWQHQRRRAMTITALAASLVLAMTVVINYRDDAGSLPALNEYAAALDTTASGTPVTVGDAELLTRFSFLNQESRYCRQYQLANTTARSENIACRNGDQWTLTGTVALPAAVAGEFQPANVSPELDSLLNAQMQGPALALDAEERLINNQWRDPARP